MAIHWKPDDMPTLSSCLPGGAELMEFMREVFGAEEKSVYHAGGVMVHGEMRVGDSLVMTDDPRGDHELPPGAVSIYVADCDAAYKRALDAGAESRQAPTDQFWGDRSARIVDPFGNTWSMATRVEEVSEEEVHARMAALEE